MYFINHFNHNLKKIAFYYIIFRFILHKWNNLNAFLILFWIIFHNYFKISSLWRCILFTLILSRFSLLFPHPDKNLYVISDLGALEHGQCVYHSLDSSERQVAGPVLPRAGREVPQEQVSLQ